MGLIRHPHVRVVLALAGALSLLAIHPASAAEQQYDAFGVPNTNVLSGTASVTLLGTASLGVVTQGAPGTLPWLFVPTNTSGTALTTANGVKVDGSAVTQPVSVSAHVTVDQGASSSIPFNSTKTTPDGSTNEDSADVPHVSSVTLAAGGGATQLVSTTAHITGFTIVPWSGAVFVGPSTVTLTNGFPVSASQSYGATCFTCTAYYATGSNNVTVRVITYTDR